MGQFPRGETEPRPAGRTPITGEHGECVLWLWNYLV
jgi:hypothetical protein